MDLKVINDKGESLAPVAASEALFGRDFNEALVHQVVVAYQANGRAGTLPRRTAAMCATPPRSRGVRREPVEPARA